MGEIRDGREPLSSFPVSPGLLECDREGGNVSHRGVRRLFPSRFLFSRCVPTPSLLYRAPFPLIDIARSTKSTCKAPLIPSVEITLFADRKNIAPHPRYPFSPNTTPTSEWCRIPPALSPIAYPSAAGGSVVCPSGPNIPYE